MKTITLKKQLEAFEKGIILDSNGKESICFNFYDWFCKDSSLKGKSIILFKKVKTFLKHHPEIDTKKTYVFFKNNCPVYGSLYDDFRICDIKEGNVMYTVTPKSGYKSDKEKNIGSTIWGSKNNFEKAIKEAKNYRELFK